MSTGLQSRPRPAPPETLPAGVELDADEPAPPEDCEVGAPLVPQPAIPTVATTARAKTEVTKDIVREKRVPARIVGAPNSGCNRGDGMRRAVEEL